MDQESFNRDQEGAGCQQPEAPLLCVNNCGFLGSPATMNLCSKCYRDVVLKEDNQLSSKALGEKPLVLSALVDKTLTKAAAAVAATSMAGQGGLVALPSSFTDQASTEPLTIQGVACSSFADISAQGLSPAVVAARQQPLVGAQDARIHQPGATRCLSCRKRVGLFGFKCRCGGMFCSMHRYSDKHSCTFDYKAAARDAIAKANPVVKAEKIGKI